MDFVHGDCYEKVLFLDSGGYPNCGLDRVNKDYRGDGGVKRGWPRSVDEVIVYQYQYHSLHCC